jgi:flagellar motor component MotA
MVVVNQLKLVGFYKLSLDSREAEAGRSIKAVEMISDALPGVGIVAAVLRYY